MTNPQEASFPELHADLTQVCFVTTREDALALQALAERRDYRTVSHFLREYLHVTLQEDHKDGVPSPQTTLKI